MATFQHLIEVLTGRSRQNIEELEDATRRATNALQRGDGAARAFGEAAGQIATSAGKVSGLLGRINPQFEEQARLVADVADAAEVAASGWGRLAPILGRIGIAGPVAAAGIAAIGTAAVVVANQTGEARAELERYRDTIESSRNAANRLIQSQNALAVAQGNVAGFVAELQVQTALLNGEISQSDVAAGELGGKLVDALRPQLLAAGRAVAETTVEIQGLEQALNSGKLNTREIREAGERLEALRALAPQLQAELDQLKQAQDEGADAINAYAAALDAANESTDTIKTTITATTDEVLTLTAALEGIDLRTLGRITGQATPGGTSAGPFVLQDLGPQIDAAADSDREQIIARRQQRLGAVSTGLSAVANPAAALGALGPAGGILQGLSAIGGLGSEGVERQLDELLNGIVGGVEALPEILVEVIPAFISALLTELPRALLELIPNLVRALIEGWQNRRDDGVPGGTAAYSDNPDVQRELENREAASSAAARDPFGASTARTSRAATTGRIARAQGAARLSIARSATARGAGGAAVNIQVNQLGPADATQDSYLRTLGRLQDQTTGLRG